MMMYQGTNYVCLIRKDGKLMVVRTATVERKTKETDIKMDITLDGIGNSKIETGIGFFDHMLTGFAKHGFFDLNLQVAGDLYVDGHHTVEDTGIVIGHGIRKALGDKAGIVRYGSVIIPMDDALVLCAIDLSGRPYLSFDANFTVERVGYLETNLIHEFFYAITYSAAMNLHIKVLNGTNDHHIIEAMFKAFGKALDSAIQYDTRIQGALSTKGTVE